jgi:hypothetical protein
VKICTKCGKTKPLAEFYPSKVKRDGRRNHCMECEKAASNARWAIVGPPNRTEYGRLWRLRNPRYNEIYRKAWRAANPEKEKAIWDRANKKKLSTPKGKLSGCMRARMVLSLKKGSKANRHWEDLVGYSVDKLKRHLEKHFTAGMTWENHGAFWHIDHKIPIAAFNYSTPDDLDFRRCWALKNLQPLKVKENFCKNDRLDRPFQPSLSIIL